MAAKKYVLLVVWMPHNMWERHMPQDTQQQVHVPGFKFGQGPNATSFSKETRPAAANKGKPVGTLSKITRTMKDAAVAAAEELPGLTRAIRSFLPQLSPQECANYFTHAGYASI
jgi:hypothetical protein